MFALPIIVLLLIAIFTTWSKSVLEGYYAKRVPDPSRYFWSFGLIQSAVCGVMIAVGYRTWPSQRGWPYNGDLG